MPYKLVKNDPLSSANWQKNDEDQMTLSSNLKLLQRDGLIGIVPREDRRAKLVAISKAGPAR
jgi:hypothetical protein